MAAQEISKEQWVAWEKIYRTGWRQLHRYRQLGILNKDPCPLDNPALMPIWWARNKKHVCPEKILQAARDAGASDIDLAQTRDHQQSHSLLGPIDITQFDVDEGQAVAQQRQLVGALWNQLTEAYAKGRSTDLLQSQYVKAAKALRELERDDREDRAHRGKFLPREVYERDAAMAADMLRQLHDSMTRRVIELCLGLPPKHRRIVTDSLTRVFAAQSRIFQRLTDFTSPENLLAELAAA